MILVTPPYLEGNSVPRTIPRMPFFPPKKRAQGFDVVRYRRRCGERLGCFGVCAGSRARRGKRVVCLVKLR